MKYRFDRNYLLKLLIDCKRKYKNREITENSFLIITTLIEELIYGEFEFLKKESVPTLSEVKENLINIKTEIGEENILKLLELSQEFLDNSKYYKNYNIKDIHTSEKMVNDVLRFYEYYDEKQYFQLIKDVFTPSCKLEIINSNIITRNIFSDVALAVPYYNLDFIRIIKENRIYDYAALCHEFRHIIDTKESNNIMADFNVLREVNPIYMELLYSRIKSIKNPKYLSGIKGRINFLRECANIVQNSMLIMLEVNETNNLKLKTIEKLFETEDKKFLNSILIDLNNCSIYDYIIYLIGFLGGITICNIALENIKEAKNMTHIICDSLIDKNFIPTNISNVLGNDFLNKNSSIKEYKKFMKETL